MIRPAALILLVVLSGCSTIGAIGSATQPLDAFEIRSVGDLPRASGGPVSRSVIVETPAAGGAIDTDRILIRPSALEASYLPGSRWTDPVPVMVQTLIVRALQQSGGVRFVGRRPLGPGGDFALLTEVTDFQAEVAPDGVTVLTRIRIAATMVREEDAAVVASRSFEVTSQAASNETIDVVNALDASMGRLMPDLVQWAMGAVGARVS